MNLNESSPPNVVSVFKKQLSETLTLLIFIYSLGDIWLVSSSTFTSK